MEMILGENSMKEGERERDGWKQVRERTCIVVWDSFLHGCEEDLVKGKG